ncbi:ABC transporter substrate-binding protein [Clostridium frigidicarnis]|uniref:Peptide/nickel transport system substrate-binding protein n=1 Tax=Clostridium frigidicarnis TaxID=84698 RepID=A0A1I1B926_9CLOT|nr:ABC transporter substrate-binding protein [Clostridium frigidicarnis]SFB45188.1 peptide/nickel transport system substrate-binding protein [Clostridium frigidicarnis]
MKKVILSILVVSQLFFSGCVQKKDIETLNEKSDLTYSLEQLPRNLCMFKDDYVRSQDLLCALFDGLVTLNANNEISEGLAGSYNISNDGITYTFKLREGISWSSEKPIVASDFVEFFKNLLDSKAKNAYVSELYCIYGAEDFNKGKKTFKDVAIDAPDNSTLTIRLNSDTPEFLKILTKPMYRLRRNFDKLSDIEKNFKEVDYSGAYVIDSFKNENILELKRNNSYWDKPLEEKISIVANSPEKALASFNSGKVDLMFDLPLKETTVDEEVGNLKFTPDKDMYALIFNYEKKDLCGNYNFRKTINETIKFLYSEEDMYSKAGLIEGNGDMAFSTLEKDSIQTSSKQLENVDISKINSLFKEMDFDKGKLITLVSQNDNKSKLIVEELEKVFKEDLGLRINKKYFSKDDYNKVLENGSFDIALNIYKNPERKDTFLKMWTKDNKKNVSKYSNNDYDKIVNKTTINKQEKESMILSSISILSKDIAYIPVYYDSLSYATSKNIKDIELDGNNNVVFKTLYKNGIED